MKQRNLTKISRQPTIQMDTRASGRTPIRVVITDSITDSMSVRKNTTTNAIRRRPCPIRVVITPYLSVTATKTRNSADKSTDTLIPLTVLSKCEESVKKGEPPKKFLDGLYKTDEYKKFVLNMGKKTLARGSNAKNWRNIDGVYICSSLHEVDKIYQTLGKRIWCDTHNGAEAGTWINPPDPEKRCTAITSAGSRCKRSITSSGKSPCLCTQHFKCL